MNVASRSQRRYANVSVQETMTTAAEVRINRQYLSVECDQRHLAGGMFIAKLLQLITDGCFDTLESS